MTARKIDDSTRNNTALSAARAAGRTARQILTGERAATLPRDAGTYMRTKVNDARRLAVSDLDARIGYDKRADPDARLAFFLAFDSEAD